jgi:biotin synthase
LEAIRLRRAYFGNQIKLHILENAKQGGCSEDCSYCAQSLRFLTHITPSAPLRASLLIEQAKEAKKSGAYRFCMAIARRGATKDDIKTIGEVVWVMKNELGIKTCFSSGFLEDNALDFLKSCGLDRINHNLNAPKEVYPRICSSHSYEDRLDMARRVKERGLGLCCGFILGMGEGPAELAGLFEDLAELKPEAIPINFLIPIPGTPLEGAIGLNSEYCLRAVSVLRLYLPQTEIRLAAGRERHLGVLEPLGFLVADSAFLGDYLTVKGQEGSRTLKTVMALGLTPIQG